MKNKISKILCVALALLMTLPAVVLPVGAEEQLVDYAEAEDGDLLLDINFKGDYWSKDFENSDNSDANITVSEDGKSLNIALIDATNDRAMWGGLLDG